MSKCTCICILTNSILFHSVIAVQYQRSGRSVCMMECLHPLLRSVIHRITLFFFFFFFFFWHACTHSYTHAQHSVKSDVDANSFGLSDTVFLPTIQSQGTDEQKEKWLPLINDYTVIGAYAQTEIGHGESHHE